MNNAPQYNYQIILYKFQRFISIVDLDSYGHKSVTNDIENVVDQICKKHNIQPHQFLIIYQDSEKNWDGWDAAKKTFIPLRSNCRDDALKAYIKKRAENGSF